MADRSPYAGSMPLARTVLPYFISGNFFSCCLGSIGFGFGTLSSLVLEFNSVMSLDVIRDLYFAPPYPNIMLIGKPTSKGSASSI